MAESVKADTWNLCISNARFIIFWS